MYKYYSKSGYNIMQYNFDSIHEFIRYIESAPVSSAFSGRSLESERIENNGSWYKTKSLDEAKKLATYGYHEDFNRFLELKMKLEKFIKLSSSKAKQFNYYVGYAPDVKAYLEGSPLSMLNKKNPVRKQIDIYYNAANLARVSAQQIYNRGVITLSIAEALEKLGFCVNLNVFTMSEKGSQIHFAVFRLKNLNERINIQKLFFPMCHPSWLRRLVFKLREVTPDINGNWVDGYGTPCDEKTIRKIINLGPNDIVIAKADEMGVKGGNIAEDAQRMFDHINGKRETEDFELPNLESERRR